MVWTHQVETTLRGSFSTVSRRLVEASRSAGLLKPWLSITVDDKARLHFRVLGLVPLATFRLAIHALPNVDGAVRVRHQLVGTWGVLDHLMRIEEVAHGTVQVTERVEVREGPLLPVLAWVVLRLRRGALRSAARVGTVPANPSPASLAQDAWPALVRGQ